MKKVYSVVLAVVLSMLMVMPVLASPSPVAEDVAPAKAVKVEVANIIIKELPENVKKEVADFTSNPTHLTNLGVQTTAKLASSFDIICEGEVSASGVQIPFKVTTAKVGDYAYVLHRSSKTGAWDVAGQGILGADVMVVGTFTDFSPVAIMVVDAANVSSATKSPKTGQ